MQRDRCGRSGLAAVAAMTLALGVGANTTFSVVNAVMWRPLPFSNPDRETAESCCQ